MKGISPLVATVLLIAFTVAVAGVVSMWVTSFTKSTTTIAERQSRERINCTYGSIALSNVNYCSTTGYLSGRLANNGIVTLGSIRLQEIYENGSSPTQGLCLVGSSIVTCTTANLSIPPGYLYTFNISGISPGFQSVNVITDCAGVTDVVYTWSENC
jgi:flagellin-like protein